MKEIDVVILTTNTNNIDLPMDQFLANYTTSLPLLINNKGPFSFHYAVWPYICLCFIIAIVWLFIYLSLQYSRRHRPKIERHGLSSVYTIHDSTIAGGDGYEISTLILSSDV